MNKLKLMPERKKFQHAFDMARLYQKYVLPFVEQQLGYAEIHNLRSIWQAAIIPIHEHDPDLDKYTQSYSNWLWIAHCSHDLLTERLPVEALSEYKRLLLWLYEQKLDNPDLFILRSLKAYGALAKTYLYELQWVTPLELFDLFSRGVSCRVNDCKVLQSPGAKSVCKLECQAVGTAYALKIYHLNRVTTPANYGCMITLIPIAS
jgi:hypothetical protein